MPRLGNTSAGGGDDNDDNRRNAATAYHAAASIPLPIRLGLLLLVLWITHNATTLDYREELRSYLRETAHFSDDEVDKHVPKTLPERQKDARKKEEGLNDRVDRLEKIVDGLQWKVFDDVKQSQKENSFRHETNGTESTLTGGNFKSGRRP